MGVGDNSRHLISINIGELWAPSTIKCSNCKDVFMKEKKISPYPLFKCMRCGYEIKLTSKKEEIDQ